MVQKYMTNGTFSPTSTQENEAVIRRMQPASAPVIEQTAATPQRWVWERVTSLNDTLIYVLMLVMFAAFTVVAHYAF